MSTPAYIVTANGISIYMNGTSHTINRDHPRFAEVAEALKTKAYDTLDALLNVSKAIATYLSPDPDFTLEGGVVVLGGEAFDSGVSEKVVRMMADGFDVQPILNFLKKVRKNPSSSAQRELLLFCEANAFAIHEDGDIVAYKAVREDYTDMHTGRYDNKVGSVVSMPRHQVDDRRDVTCSHGLHFAAYEYAKDFGAAARHVMVLKINPEDVVSIPSDYNNQKGRCCRYEVVAERTDFTPLPAREVYSSADFQRDGEEEDLNDFEDEADDVEAFDDEDRSFNPAQLKAKYGDEHPSFTKDDWRYQVSNDDTNLGYWEWVESEIANS